MNILDILIIIPLAWGGFKGFSRGFVQEIAQFAALIAGVFAGLYLSDWISAAIINIFNSNPGQTKLIAFVIAFIGAMILVFFVSKIVCRIINSMSLGLPNRIAGAVLGAAKYIIIISVLVNVINNIDQKGFIIGNETRSKSLMYKPMGKVVPFILPKISNLLPEENNNEENNDKKTN